MSSRSQSGAPTTLAISRRVSVAATRMAEKRTSFTRKGPPVDGRVVASCPFYELHQPEVAIVVRVGRPLGGIVDVPKIAAWVGREIADLDRRQDLVPPGRVVGPALPGVVDRNQPRALGIAGGGQVAMPGEEFRVYLAQEGARLRASTPVA